MFDNLLNPWVIEVNLSPACKEKRASFLTEMLDNMTDDLVNWLERKILTSAMPDEHSLELSKAMKAKRSRLLASREMFENHPYLNLPDYYEQA